MNIKIRYFFSLITIFLLTISSCVNNDTSSSSTDSDFYSSIDDTSEEILIDFPIIQAINDVYNIDFPDDLSFLIDFKDYSFTAVTGLGINAGDYSLSGNTLTIFNNFLKYFYKNGPYSLSLGFEKNHRRYSLPFSFNILYENEAYRIINGGFETGDLYGWDHIPIWKNESGLYSWIDERIVSTPYYGSANDHIYNRDGNYHLGVYRHPYSNANKDINQERMGIIRSSDFILGDSGYISFKLGGGQNTGSAYISIKETATNIEIARYGNRHFGNTTLSQTINAEAYLFQYYADLSHHLGKSLYILITDGASHEWNVLACDSFITNYQHSPFVTDDQLAHDIKPSIFNATTAINAIPGNLSTNIDNWEDPNSIFQWSSGRAQTNRLNGDNNLGVIRSPAFTIDKLANTHLSFEWEGNIALDKQLFAFVKEVTTNIELLRLVRRNNLIDKNSGGMDKHWYDLSSLDQDKEYYVEFVDNAIGSWGLISIKNVYLLPSTDQSVSVITDKAVNTYYGLNHVDPYNGGHRQYRNDWSYYGGIDAFNIVSTYGSDTSSQMRINYHTYRNNTYLQLVNNDSITNIAPTCNLASLEGYQGRFICQVELNNLDVNIAYSYSINRGYHGGETYQFKTLDNDDSLKLLFMTDTQAVNWATSSIYKTMLDAALAYEDDLRFCITAGDIVEVGGNINMWEWYFETASRYNNLPMNTVPGNHDYYVIDDVFGSNIYYEQYFNNPDNGPTSINNSSYYFVGNDTLFIMLDALSNNYGESVIPWFNEVVSNNPTSFIVVTTHYSAYGSHHVTTASNFLNLWGPVFDYHQVDIVLSGHDHVYARTPLMFNKLPSLDPNIGTIYLTGGSASNKLYSVPDSLKAQYAFVLEDNKNIISIVTINNGTITFTAIDKDGVVEDYFTIYAKDRSSE